MLYMEKRVNILADQYVYLNSLISPFFISFLESIIAELATSKISIL